jgi:hybrid cluster-associated redox disulfide protein
MAATIPTSDMTVAEVLERWPEAVSVFQEFKTACVGCSMAPFDTMVDVAREYDLALPEIMAALDRTVNVSGPADGATT